MEETSILRIAKSSLSMIFRRSPIELTFWTGSLVFLMVLNPDEPAVLNLCLSKALGFGECPGCGLGQSVSFLIHGQPGLSIQAHLLGPFALAIILYRVIELTSNLFTIHRKETPHA